MGLFQRLRRVVRAAVTGDLTGATKPSRHDAIHWGTVVVCLLGVTWLIHLLEASPAVLGYRYGMFQLLSRVGARDFSCKDVVVALIDDETYWRGEPAGRVPTDRRYLAKLTRRIAEAEPRLIALDFDLRSPDPEGKIRSSTARSETASADQPSGESGASAPAVIELPVHQAQLGESIELFRAVDEAAASTLIVLPSTVKHIGDTYRAVSDADDGFPFTSAHIEHGYIQLADDRRVIPPQLPLEDGGSVDSFCIAIVRQTKPGVLKDGERPEGKHDEPLRYSSFLPRNLMATVTTSELFSDSDAAKEATKRIRGKIVLIGADWHSRSLGEGPLIDSHPSPVGLLPGVMLHANYVESLLQGKFVTPAGMKAATLVEWALTALVAFLMMVKIGWRAKIAWFVGIAGAYPLLSLISMRFMGVYTDVLLLTVALALHLLADVPTRVVHLTLKVKELENRLAGHGVQRH